MKSFARFIIVLMTLMVTSINSLSAAVAYPVQLNAQILPPFTNCLGDYVAGDLCRIKVTGLLRDLTKTQGYDVGISVKVMQGSQLRFSSITNHVERLNPNEIHQFKLNDLFAETNLNAQYNSDGYCLKEGGYEFIFQAFDKGNAKLPLSEPVHFYAYLSQSEPPRLISPADGECVNYQSAAVNFVWMESTIGSFNPNKSFRIEVFEIPENAENFDQQALINSNVTKFTIENIPGNINFESFANTAGRLVKGRTYLWRVQTYDKTEQVSDKKNIYSSSSQYANGGYSKVYSFKYANCLPFEMKKDSVDNTKKPEITRIDSTETSSTIEWKNEPDKFPCGYIVAYNKAGDTLSNWAKVEVGADASSYTFKNIAPGVRYITHIIGICECTEGEEGSEGDKVLSAASDDSTFTLPKPAEKECHSNIDALTSQKSAETLEKGNYITANGQNVKLTQIERIITEKGDTVFSGKGVVYCPLLENKLGISVKFDSIKINANNEVMVGKVYAPTDLTNAAFLDADGLVNEGYTGTGAAPLQDAKYTTYTSKEEIPVGKIGVVDGVLYSKNADGTFTKLGTLDANGKLECEPQENGVDYKQGEVVFSPESYWNPPFDYNKEPFKDASIEDYYMNLNMGMSKRYDVPWIAMEDGKATTIKARFNDVQSDVVDADIVFACQTKDEMVILESTYDESKKEHTVTIYGGEAEKSLNIYAIYAGNGKCYTLGRARIQNMPSIEQTLVLVPVGRTKESVDKEGIETYLNQIYGKLGVKYNVTVDEEFGKEEDGDFSFMADGLAVTGTGFMTTETDDMKQLKKLYKQSREIKDDAAYIFILKKAKTDDGSEVAGDMPRSHQVGYVFSEDAKYSDAATIAHELGHGLYSFEHTFENKGAKQGSTDNLMDYSDIADKMLKVWQWNLLYTHKNYTVPFLEDDEDAMYKPWTFIGSQLVYRITHGNENLDKMFHCVLNYNGEKFALPSNATNIYFNQGRVVSFELNGESFIAMFNHKNVDDPQFIGYYKDAKFANNDDLARDNYAIDPTTTEKYKEFTEYSTDYVYMPLFYKMTEDDECEQYDLYQVYCKADGSLDSYDAYYDLQNNGSEYKKEKVLENRRYGLNCLPYSVKRLYLFMVNHYNRYKYIENEVEVENTRTRMILLDYLIQCHEAKIKNIDSDYNSIIETYSSDSNDPKQIVQFYLPTDKNFDVTKFEDLLKKYTEDDLGFVEDNSIDYLLIEFDNYAPFLDYNTTSSAFKRCSQEKWEMNGNEFEQRKNMFESGKMKIDDFCKFINDTICHEWLKTLNYNIIENTISLISNKSKKNFNETVEITVLQLISSINVDDYARFINYLSNDNYAMLRRFVSDFDDSHLFFGLDSDNYTQFIRELSKMNKKKPQVFIETVSVDSWDLLYNSIDLTTGKFETEFDKKTGLITLKKEGKVYDKYKDVNPFTPVVLYINTEKEPELVNSFVNSSTPIHLVVCPIIFLKYRDDKIFVEKAKFYAELAFEITVDALTVFSGGLAFIAAYRGVQAINKICAVATVYTMAVSAFDVYEKIAKVNTALDDLLTITSDLAGDWTFVQTFDPKATLSLTSGIATIVHTLYKAIKLTTKKDQFEQGLNDLIQIQLKLKKLGISLPSTGIAEDILSVSSDLVPNGTLDEMKFVLEENRNNGLKDIQNDASSYFAHTVHVILTVDDYNNLLDYRFGELSINEDVTLEGERLVYFDRSLYDYYTLDQDFKVISREKLHAGLLNKMTGLNLTDDGYAILSCSYDHEYFNAEKVNEEADKESSFIIPKYKVSNLTTNYNMMSDPTLKNTIELVKYDRNGNKEKTIRYIPTSY